MSLRELLDPSTVVIVRASDQRGKVGNVILENLKKSTAGPFPVNTYHDFVDGMISYPTITDLPVVPDLAVIAIPAKYTVDVIH